MRYEWKVEDACPYNIENIYTYVCVNISVSTILRREGVFVSRPYKNIIGEAKTPPLGLNINILNIIYLLAVVEVLYNSRNGFGNVAVDIHVAAARLDCLYKGNYLVTYSLSVELIEISLIV